MFSSTLKKSGSGPLGDKKTKPSTKPMKDKPFAYQQQSPTKRHQDHPDSQVFQHAKTANQEFVSDEQIIEVRQDQDLQVDSRPSDEVQYSDARLTGFAGDSSQANFIPQPHQSFGNMRGTQSSFQVIEEKKQHDKTPDDIRSPLTQFEVIQEDTEEMHSTSIKKYNANNRQNSDYKRFDIDDEYQDKQNLRMGNKMLQEEVKELNSKFRSHDIYEEEEKSQNAKITHESPQIQKTKNSERYAYHDSNTSFELNQHLLNQPNIYSQTSFGQLPLRNNFANDFHNDSNLHDPLSNPMQQPLDASMQLNQQKLQELLMSSNGNLTDLQHVLQNTHVDDKSLNNMIDMEKNYVIIQYEKILQALNVEFHKLLAKNSDLEEAAKNKENFIQTQAMIIQDKEEQLFNSEQQCRMLKSQIQELQQEVEFVSQQSQRNVVQENDSQRFDRDMVESQLLTLKNKMNLQQEQEMDLRQQIDILQQRIRQQESTMRLKDEDLFQMSRDNQTLQRDTKNLADVEQTLKLEITKINQYRLSIEDQLQEQKQNNLSQQLHIRQREMEVESLIRENRSLKGTLDIIQENYNDIINENNNLKENQTDAERQKLMMKSHIEKQDREVMRLQQELKRQQMMIDQEQSEKQILQDQLRQAMQQQQKLQRDLLQRPQSQQVEQTYIQYPPSKVQPDQYPPPKVAQQEYPPPKVQYDKYPPPKVQEDQYPPPKVSSAHKTKYNKNEDFLNNTMTNLDPNTNQERNTTFYSPQRNSRVQFQSSQEGSLTKQAVAQPTSNKQADKNNWTNDSYQQNSQRRRTINQNESQLNDVLSWQQKPQNTNQFQNARSLDRDQYQKVFQQQQPNQAYNDNNWTQNKSALAQFQQSNNKQQDQALPAAGKKTFAQQSPLEVRNQNFEQQVTHLQNTLCALQMDKERIENEYRRYGTQSKNKQQMEKKQELELEIDIVNKNIQNLKQKLREMNAF